MRKKIGIFVSWITPVIIIAFLLIMFSTLRYQEKTTVGEAKVIEDFYSTHKK
jgi:cbb3-type cytochrome oxidase subunit 3